MTVPTTTAFTGPYYPNGVTVDYPFAFKVNATDEVSVFYIEDDGSETLVPSADYTVVLSSNENNPGGTVTTQAPLPDSGGKPLYIALDPDFTQSTKFEDEGAFNQSILNPTFDAGALRSIWLRARLLRAPILPLDPSSVVGMFPVVNLDGTFGWALGTGSDPALRQELALFPGAGLLGFSHAINYPAGSVGAALRWEVNIRNAPYNAKGDGVTDDTAAFAAAIAAGAKKIFVPAGNYVVNNLVIAGDGVTIEGEGDFVTFFLGTGANPIFNIGDAANNITQHVTLKNMTIGGSAAFSGAMYVRVRRCFQTYFERVRYKRSLKNPTEAIYVLDNFDGTSEQPVRVTFRDCYIDGVNYATGLSAAPIGIWNTGGIQVIVSNTHIQDCEIGCKLGVNPAVDLQYYDAGHPNDDDFYDFYFTDNSRYQVGDRGGTTSNARAFDVWKGSGLHVSNSQFYLNNNGPMPALANQAVAVFNRTGANFGAFTMDQCVVNCNARADYIVRIAANVQVQRIAITSTEFGGMVAGKPLILKGAGAVCKAVISPDCVFDNTNHFGVVDQRTNVAVQPYDLGTASCHYLQLNDGAARVFSSFANAAIGVTYIMQVEITAGSTLNLTAAAPGASAGIVVDGFQAGNIALRNGDILLITRVPLAAADYCRAKIIRGGVLVASVVHLIPAALPAGAADGWVIVDSADGKMKVRRAGVWDAAT